MAETDILNPNKTGYDRIIHDSMNPNYGWQRTRKSTLAMIKPAFGRPWSLNVANGGHAFTLNYTRRNLAVTERLKQFHEQFEDGFFTLRDYDLGRDYVGNFVGDIPQSLEVYGRFTSANWIFQEIPGCPMLVYPSQWERWAVTMRPFDDYGDQKTASVGASWSQVAPIVGLDGVARPSRQLQCLVPVAGDYATHEYRGYGFRLWALTGPTYGQAKLYVDGIAIQQLDFYAAAALGPTLMYTNASMPLNYHRVQVVMTGGMNANSAGTGMVWDKLEVMR